MADIQSDVSIESKLPHQSKTVQYSTVQAAAMFLLHYYFPEVDSNVFIAWGLIFSYGMRFISKDEIKWYGSEDK